MAPLKKFKQKSEVDIPFFDKELVRLASIRDKSYKQAIVEKDPMKRNELYAYFQSDRNTFQSAIKKKKYEYYNKKIEEESLSSKKLWQTTSSIINPNKKKYSCPIFNLKRT